MFKSEILHDPNSVNAFTKTQFNIFEKRTRLIMLTVSFVLLISGALNIFNKSLSLILILFGCLVLVDIGNIPKRTADRILKANKTFDRISYVFGEKDITVTQNGKEASLAYSSIIRIAKDRSYAYLFVNKMQVYMLELKKITPEGTEPFLRFIEDKTGLSWSGTGAMLRLNVKELFGRLSSFIR